MDQKMIKGFDAAALKVCPADVPGKMIGDRAKGMSKESSI